MRVVLLVEHTGTGQRIRESNTREQHGMANLAVCALT